VACSLDSPVLIARFRPLISHQKDAEKAAKAGEASTEGIVAGVSTSKKEEQKTESGKETTLPLRGVVAEEQAPPPAAAP
jgi:methionyl-tRNA synthetase